MPRVFPAVALQADRPVHALLGSAGVWLNWLVFWDCEGLCVSSLEQFSHGLPGN